MDNIYKFKASSSASHLKSFNNDKQFYSEDESTKTKQQEEKQLKQVCKPPSKMSQFSQNLSGYQTDDSDKDSPKNAKAGPSCMFQNSSRNLVNSVEGDNEDVADDGDDFKQQHKHQNFKDHEDPYNIIQQSQKVQDKIKNNKNQKSQQINISSGVSSDYEQIKQKQYNECKMKNHPFRHLIYGPTIGENTFKKFLMLTQKGLIYSRKCLKGPSDKFIKQKTIILQEAPIPKAKTLLLDLDETLIHSCSAREKPQTCITAVSEYGEEARIYLNVRPFCQWFLQQMSQLYTIYVYTASSSAYANAVVQFLDPKKQWIMGILSRPNCMETKNGFFIKDLRIIGNKQVKNMLIVDNLAHSFGFQIENGIPILEWHNDQNDQELKYLATYLMEAADKDDLRAFNKSQLRLDDLIEYKFD